MVASMTRVRPGLIQFGQRALVRGAVPEGEAVPEGSESLLLVTGREVGYGQWFIYESGILGCPVSSIR